jgi:putative ABC transport system permease protein
LPSAWRPSRTDLGLALRAAGNNLEMARASGINVDAMVLLALGLSNGLIALGVTFAQFRASRASRWAWERRRGVATLMIGEVLTGRRTVGRWIAGAVGGAVIFRLVVAAAIRAGLNPNALARHRGDRARGADRSRHHPPRPAWRPLPGASSRA